MDMDSAAAFLAGSILYGVGIVFGLVCCVVINNILNRFWKPVRIFTKDSWVAFNPPVRYATDEELKTLDKTVEPKLNK